MSDDVNSDGITRPQIKLIDRLKSGTILGILHQLPKIPENVIDFMRRWSLGSDTSVDNDPNAPENDHKWAFRRLQRLWESPPHRDKAEDVSAVSKFNTARKLCTAYWTGEKSKQAWMQTGIIAGLSAFLAQDTVWAIQASAELVGSLANFKVEQPETLTAIYNSLGKVGLYGAAMIGINDGLNRARFAMRRGMTDWMTSEFMSAMYHDNDSIQRFTHNRDKSENGKSKQADEMPDNPHQTIGQNIKMMNQLLTYFGTETIGLVCTTALITKTLYDRSVPIDFLDRFGAHLNQVFPNGITDFQLGNSGSFALSMACGAGFLALILPKAKEICKNLEENYLKVMSKSGNMTDFLVNTFNRGEEIAATKGHGPTKESHQEIYEELRQTIEQDDKNFRRYARYQEIIGLIGSRVIPLIPGFAAFTSGRINLQGFTEMQGLVTGTIWSVNNYMMQTLPSIARIKTYANSISEVAQMIDKTQDKEAFYQLSGVHEFQRGITDDPTTALSLSGLELKHRGMHAETFLKVPSVDIAKGEWVIVEGVSGSGKSCLFKSIVDLWPYGRGEVKAGRNSKTFYARQDPVIDDHFTLAEQVLHGMDSMPVRLKDYANQQFSEKETVRDRVRWALETAGLNEFTENMDDPTQNGRPWSKALSGGQRQRLVLARMLFQQPDVILLDEATSALNPEAKKFFFETLKSNAPAASVIAIVHDATLPRDGQGQPFFDKKLKIDKGVAHIEDIESVPVALYTEVAHTGFSSLQLQ